MIVQYFTFQIRQLYIYIIIQKNDIYVQQTNNNSNREISGKRHAIFLGIAVTLIYTAAASGVVH